MAVTFDDDGVVAVVVIVVVSVVGLSMNLLCFSHQSFAFSVNLELV